MRKWRVHWCISLCDSLKDVGSLASVSAEEETGVVSELLLVVVVEKEESVAVTVLLEELSTPSLEGLALHFW